MLEEIDKLDFINRLLDNDERAYVILVERVTPPLLWYFSKWRLDSQRNRRFSEDDKYDLIATTLKRVYEYLPRTFDPCKGRLTDWIFSIAKRTAIDYWKNLRRRNELQFDPESAISWDNTAYSGSDSLSADESIVEKAFKSLADDVQDILSFRIHHNLTFKEIGELLNITEGSARIRFHRAKKKLKTELLGLESREKRRNS